MQRKSTLPCRVCLRELPREAFDLRPIAGGKQTRPRSSCRECQRVTLAPKPKPHAPNPKGLCACGCGERTAIAVQTSNKHGRVCGEPVRFLPGHNFRTSGEAKEPNPSGLCRCGCGEAAPLADSTNKKRGIVEGKPQRFLPGHHGRKGPVDYIESAKTGCWVWQRYKDSRGYGQTAVRGKPELAHRVYYERVYGPIPEGKEIDHLCRNHACVRPDHLEAVSHVVNVRRGRATTLSDADVENIIACAGRETHVETSRRYGVTPTAIRAIRARRRRAATS